MIGNQNKSKIKRNIFIFCSYFLYKIIFIIILDMLNVDITKFNMLLKNIYLILPDIIYLIFIIIIYKNEIYKDLKELKNNFSNKILKFIPYYIVGIIVMVISNLFISYITGNSLSENEINVREYIKLYPLYMTFSTILYAPIVEELIYRKCFRNILENNLVFIITSGIIFGLVHMTTGTFNDFLTIVPYILIGIDFSYIYYKSKNIFTTISLHMLHNFILLIIQFIGG